jgi:hypothetical protein
MYSKFLTHCINCRGEQKTQTPIKSKKQKKKSKKLNREKNSIKQIRIVKKSNRTEINNWEKPKPKPNSLEITKKP